MAKRNLNLGPFVLGVSIALFISVSLLFSVWIVAPFFLSLIVIIFIIATIVGTWAAKRAAFPELSMFKALIVLVLLWPMAVVLPYGILVAELNMRVVKPTLPPDATSFNIKPSPLAGGTTSGPAPGWVAEYLTPLNPENALNSLRKASGGKVMLRLADKKIYAIGNEKEAQVLIAADGKWSRVKVGLFSNYTSPFPLLMFFLGWVFVGILFMRPVKG